MTRLAILSIAIALAPAVTLAQLPDAPTPRRIDLTLTAADTTSRILDIVSTEHALGHGGREKELPPWIVNDTGRMVAFEASVLTVEAIGSHELRKHGHRKLARLVPVIDAAVCFATDVHNFRIQTHSAQPSMPITVHAPQSKP